MFRSEMVNYMKVRVPNCLHLMMRSVLTDSVHIGSCKGTSLNDTIGGNARPDAKVNRLVES